MPSIVNTGFLFFNGNSTAGNATITNTSDLNFNDSSTAGNASIVNTDNLNFNSASTAGGATITNAGFGTINFNFDSTAGSATIINNNNIFFGSTSTAGSATITNNHQVFFEGNSTGGNAAITNSHNVFFSGNSTGGNAAHHQHHRRPDGFFARGVPALRAGGGDRKLTVGSIAGAGSFVLGLNELTVGGNNLSTEVSGVISGFLGSLVKVGTGTLTLSGNNTYTGGTTIAVGTLRAGATNTFSPFSAMTIAGGGTLDLNGFNQTVPGVTNAGLVNIGSGTTPGTVLTTTNYFGAGGTIVLNTFLGADSSPSDKLVITNGGSATGNSLLHITNAGGPGAETVANGIQVVQAINGGTTAPGAFTLPGEVRAGAFDYRLFRGGLDPSSSPNDWFLRSTFVIGPIPPEPIIPPGPILPTDPPPQPLPPGVFPIIGPEIATYGVVQPIARQLGMTTLGTLQERTGDTSLTANAGTSCPAASDTPDGIVRKAPVKAPADCLNAGGDPWVWGRVLGQQIDNHYRGLRRPERLRPVAGLPERHRSAVRRMDTGPSRYRGPLCRICQCQCRRQRSRYQRGGDGLCDEQDRQPQSRCLVGRSLLDALRSGRLVSRRGGAGDALPGRAASTQFASLSTTGFGFVSSALELAIRDPSRRKCLGQASCWFRRRRSSGSAYHLMTPMTAWAMSRSAPRRARRAGGSACAANGPSSATVGRCGSLIYAQICGGMGSAGDDERLRRRPGAVAGRAGDPPATGCRRERQDERPCQLVRQCRLPVRRRVEHRRRPGRRDGVRGAAGACDIHGEGKADAMQRLPPLWTPRL